MGLLILSLDNLPVGNDFEDYCLHFPGEELGAEKGKMKSL